MILTPPVDAPIVRPFVYEGSPFAAGLHRGVDFAAAPGSVVRAPCTGELVWAGSSATTLECGHRRVTLVDFDVEATLGRVVTGEPMGRAGSSPLHLGVRRPADPFGYEDPERYLAQAPPPMAPVAPAPRGLRLPTRPAPAPPGAAPSSPTLPTLAWAGIAAIALGAAGRRQLALRKAKRSAAATRTTPVGFRPR